MKYVFIVIGLVLGVFLLSNFLKGCNEATNVAHKEFGAKAALKKYEWFKDASASLTEKESTILVYKAKLDKFKDEDFAKLDRITRENYMLWEQEYVGLVASYNKLAAEYNAQSSKFNWSLFEGDEVQVVKNFKTY